MITNRKLYEIDRSIFPPLISNKLARKGIYCKNVMILKPGSTPGPGVTTTLTKNDITWTFDEEVQYGTFANGDYWVIDSGSGIDIISISPPSAIVSDTKRHGSMINPATNGSNGFDGRMGTYNDVLNVGYGVSEETPLHLSADTSLISSISLETATNFTVLKSAEILTVLGAVPADGSFRPAYVGDTKTIKYNITDLNYSLLGSLAPTASVPTLTTYEGYFARPWIDFYSRSFAGQYMHPSDNMPAYGRDIARRTNDAALLLHCNYSNEQKAPLLISYVQLGIDLYEIAKTGNGYKPGWPSDGGHGEGRKWPIMFAGLILGDTDIQAIFAKCGDYAYNSTPISGSDLKSPLPDDLLQFQEDDDCFYVTSYDVTRTNSASWEPDTRAETEPYIEDNLGMPEWGIRHVTYPYRDNQHWDAMYRGANAITWQGYVLAALIMDAKTLWNHDAFFDYTYRWMGITDTGHIDPFGYTVGGQTADIDRALSTFAEEMWDTYIDTYWEA